MEKWMVSMKKADFKRISEKFNIDQVTARLIRNRDIIEDEDIDRYLNGSLKDLYSPYLMKDIEKAADILLEKISQNRPIRIIGDYDIDGVMSTYILLTAFKRLGANADESIPERIKDGYGLNESLVLKASSDGIDTIITCDNGISAGSQIALAKELGMSVIVTDHHEVPVDAETGKQTVPAADAVVDPKQDTCNYPFKALCGAVVAWKLVCVLYERSGISVEEAYDLIEFAAIATVGDVVALKDENRIIVKEGLKRLRNTSNKGLSALITLNGIEPESVDAYHIGFVIGPCLNASGRLETAQKALSLLVCRDEAEAVEAASDLIELNNIRKAMTEEYKDKAIEQIESSDLRNDHILVVYLPGCHESLAGIIAGRLRERYSRPAFVLTDSESKDSLKGSGRSIDEFSMFKEMSKCSGLFEKFGGHPLAAGLSISRDNIDAFRETMNKNCSLTDDDLSTKVHIDLLMPFSYITKELIADFDKLKPFGMANSKPVFAQKNVSVIRPKVFGKNRNAAKMQLLDETGIYTDAVYFGDADAFVYEVSKHSHISITYYPTINSYGGRESIQLNITGYRPG